MACVVKKFGVASTLGNFLARLARSYKFIYNNLDPVRTWCPCPVPGHGHESEHSLLLVPEHRFEHRARARVLAPEVVLGQGTDLNRFLSVPDVFTFSHAAEALTPNLSPIFR